MPVRDEMSVVKGLVQKGTRIVVPNSLRKEALQIIHTGHLGIEKCIAMAKEVIYWPNINKQIKEMISTCTYCRDHRNQQPSEAIIHHEIPKTPWTKVATDIFHLYNKVYVVIIDYTTRYFDIHKLDNCESHTVINKIKNTFARLGIPQIVISDNGPECCRADKRVDSANDLRVFNACECSVSQRQ